jgi:hypothetical protein
MDPYRRKPEGIPFGYVWEWEKTLSTVYGKVADSIWRRAEKKKKEYEKLEAEAKERARLEAVRLREQAAQRAAEAQRRRNREEFYSHLYDVVRNLNADGHFGPRHRPGAVDPIEELLRGAGFPVGPGGVPHVNPPPFDPGTIAIKVNLGPRDSIKALGLSGEEQLTEDGVKQAFRQKAKTCHPDLHPGKEEEFKLLQDHYDRVLDYVRQTT